VNRAWNVDSNMFQLKVKKWGIISWGMMQAKRLPEEGYSSIGSQIGCYLHQSRFSLADVPRDSSRVWLKNMQ